MCLELCLWTLLCVCSMAVMLVFAANKTIVIANVPSDLTGDDALAESKPLQGNALTLQRTSEGNGIFYIPLPKGVKAENVMVENHYIHSELWLRIECGDTGYYEENALTGDIGFINEGSCEIQDNGVLLRLKMKRVMEYRSAMRGNLLAVACYAPGDLYDYVVVLDPAPEDGDREAMGTQAQTADAVLSVARMVQKKLSLEGVRIYLTHAEGTELSREERLALTEQVEADLYIGIGVSREQEAPERYGILCYYNQEYFIPDFGNVRLADILAREVATASSNRALGLEPAAEDSLLGQIKIPAARISVGYLSNPRERELLGQESYQEKLADGILAALAKSCEELGDLRSVRAGEADVR